MKAMLVPTPRPGGLHLGVQQCVRAWLKWMPRHGIEFVDMEAQADVVHHSIGGSGDQRVDVLSFHGLHPTAELDEGNQAFGINARVISALRRAKEVVAVSEWVADIIRRDMRFDPQVIPNGVDPADWDHLERGRYSTATYALWAKNRVGGVCDPRPMNELARRVPEMAFLSTFGEDTDNVRVTGLLPFAQMQQVIKDASVYLSLTKETWGIQTLEAMICGIPVLGFDWGGTGEIVEHGVTGYLAEPGDYDGLVEGLHACLKNRNSWGNAAREKVLANWHWKDLTRRLLDVYEETLKPHEGPKVTVVIPCYNYGQYVGRAIKTVLKQSYQDFELIVVDDGSTDHSWEEIEEAIKGEDKARAIRQENAGVAYARNRGIAAGRGEYVACLDADDGMAEDFLRVTVRVMDAMPRNVGIVYSGLAIVRDDGYGWPSRWPSEYDFGHFMRLRGNCVPSLCLFKREAWERAGGYKQRFTPIEDGDLWMQMGALGFEGKKATNEGLFLYNMHKGSATLDDHGNLNPYPDNLKWQPWMKDKQAPFACLGNPPKGSWPVRNYDKPKVSVVTPVGPGHEEIIVDALDSLLAQTERHWEAIVVNDTGKRLELIGYPFVRMFNTKGKVGAGAARNVGTAEAKAPLIVYLDADDYLEPEFLEACLAVYEQYGDIVYTDCWLQRNGETIYHEFPDWDPDLLFSGTILAMTALFPKTIWEEVGGFDESLDSFEDWVFWIDACLKGHCGTRIDWGGFTYRHLTGMRREVGVEMKATMRPYFERKYGPYMRKEEKLGCAGCGGRRNAVRQLTNPIKSNPRQVTAARAPQLTGGGQMAEPVLMRYIGPSVGKRLYKVHGRHYRVGGGGHRDFYVMAEDVDFFASRVDFEVVGKPPPPPQARPTVEPGSQAVAEVPPPPEIKPLTEVKGIGPASARKLKEAGIGTVGALTMADPERVADILGFSLNRVKKIITPLFLEEKRALDKAIEEAAKGE